MKPSVTIDERGILLHVTDNDGHGVAIPLNGEALAELGAQVAIALERMKEPSARNALLWRIAKIVAAEVVKPGSENEAKNGPSDSYQGGKRDR